MIAGLGLLCDFSSLDIFLSINIDSFSSPPINGIGTIFYWQLLFPPNSSEIGEASRKAIKCYKSMDIKSQQQWVDWEI